MCFNISSVFYKLFFITLTYFIAIQALVHVIIALVLIDLVTGVWKSIKTNGIKSLNSRGYKRTVIKFGAYMLAIIATFLIEAEILKTGIYVCRLVAGLISLVEFASICENLAVITGQNVFLAIFDVLKTKININKNLINKIDGPEKHFTKEDKSIIKKPIKLNKDVKTNNRPNSCNAGQGK